MENSPLPPPQTTFRPRSHKFLAFAAAFILVVAVGAGGYLGYNHYKKPTPAVLSYQNYSHYSVQGSSATQTMSFDAPASLKQTVKTSSQIALYQEWSSAKAQGFTYLAAKAQINDPSLTTEAISAIDSSLSSYTNTVSPITNFVQTNMIDGWNTQIAAPSKFVNTNITSHAWEFNFTGTQGTGKVQGKAVYIVTSSTNYYLLVYSNAHNWQANTAAWQKVFNSIKVAG